MLRFLRICVAKRAKIVWELYLRTTRTRNTLTSEIEIFLVSDGLDLRSVTKLCDVFKPIITRRMPRQGGGSG